MAAPWLHANELYRRLPFLQIAPSPTQRPTCPQRRHKDIDRAMRVPPNLRASADVVAAWVRQVLVLADVVVLRMLRQDLGLLEQTIQTQI